MRIRHNLVDELGQEYARGGFSRNIAILNDTSEIGGASFRRPEFFFFSFAPLSLWKAARRLKDAAV